MKKYLNIGVDVDSVIADLPWAVCRLYNHYKVKEYPIMYTEDWVDWGLGWAQKFGLTPNDMYRRMDEAWIEHEKVMPILDLDVEQQLRVLREFGHTVHIITSRTLVTHAAVTAWLAAKEIPYDALSFVHGSASKLFYPIDVLIDDAPIQAEIIHSPTEVSTGRKHLFLRTQPWNKDIDCTHPRITRVSSIREMVHKLTDTTTSW